MKPGAQGRRDAVREARAIRVLDASVPHDRSRSRYILRTRLGAVRIEFPARGGCWEAWWLSKSIAFDNYSEFECARRADRWLRRVEKAVDAVVSSERKARR